jgi:long-chain fatty acid transport protein
VSAAEAGGFAIREQGATGQGSSFAGMAAGGYLSSMFWNPATLSDVYGFQSQSTANGIFINTDVTLNAPVTSDEGDIAPFALVPASYYAYRLTDRLVAGIGLNGPFGLATFYDDDSILKALGIAGTSDIFTLNANPALSYQVTDWLAIGLGAQIQYIDLRYTSQALPMFGVSTLNGNDFGFGLTAGVQITPREGTEIGVGYRSRIDHEIDGTLTSGAGIEFDATADDFDLPDTVTLGLRQSITENFRVMAGAEWSNWSRFETVNLEAAGATIPLGFDYEDGWFFSAGAEFDATDRLTLRAGVGYELSPLDDDTRTFRLPDSDRLWLSGGASFQATERFSLDLGYTYISAEEADILSAAGGGPLANGPFSGEAESNVHIIALGFRSKFGGAPQLR